MAFNLAGPQTKDMQSSNGGCVYPAAVLGNAPFTSPVIRAGGQPLQYYTASKGVADAVPGTGAPGCQSPQPRTMIVQNNTGVYFDKDLPAINNCQWFTQVAGVQRAVTGPYQHATIIIGGGGPPST